MKALRRELARALVVIIACYLVTAFVHASWDFTQWGIGTRGIMATAVCFLYVVWLFVTGQPGNPEPR